MGAIPQVLALGGGGFSMEAANPLVDDFALEITGVDRPRVCFVPTASGDADHYVVRFYRRFSAVADCSHVSLFRRDKGAGAVEGDIERHLLEQDLIYVGGGSVLSLLGTWRAHGVDAMLRRAWRGGTVLCGLSAGSLCWFAEAVTGFHGSPRRVEGLGLLPFSNCVHYERRGGRRGAYHSFLRAGMCPGYAAEDGAALHFVGSSLHRVVASRSSARGYRLDAVGERVVEMQVATTYLGDSAGMVSPLPEAVSTVLAA